MILVTGATGAQGGATARHLLARGQQVRALVRDADTPAARSLAAQGVSLAIGDMTDRGSLDAAMSGVDGVFSVQPTGADEFEMGTAVADVAAATGVDHLVYTSVAGAERGKVLGGWDSKLRIEHHIAALGLTATILRPVKFMENLTTALDIHNGLIREVWAPDQPCQVIAVDDIGWFAAAAFAEPGTYAGHTWELAGDELTHPQMAAAVSTALGRPVTYTRDTAETFAARRGIPADTIRRAIDLLDNNPWRADIPALRRMHPGLMDFDTWVTKIGTALLTTP